MSLPPYTGHTSTPLRANPRWPGILAAVSLAVFALVLPWVAFGGVIKDVSIWGGGTFTESQMRAQLAWATTGLISGLLAVGTAIAAIVGSRTTGPRVASGFSIGLGTIAALVFLVITSGISSALPHEAPDAGPPVPSCGPDSHPLVFGGDSRYTPCPEDEAVASALLDEVLPQLPTQDVTVASVEAIASQLHADVYDSTVGFDQGTIPVVVAWYPAPVTCAIAQYREPTGWEVEVSGMLVDGGCIYTAI